MKREGKSSDQRNYSRTMRPRKKGNETMERGRFRRSTVVSTQATKIAERIERLINFSDQRSCWVSASRRQSDGEMLFGTCVDLTEVVANAMAEQAEKEFAEYQRALDEERAVIGANLKFAPITSFIPSSRTGRA